MDEELQAIDAEIEREKMADSDLEDTAENEGEI